MYSPIPVEDDQRVAPRATPDRSTVHTIGIVDDNLDPALMEGLVTQLQDEVPHIKIRTWIKPSGTAPAPEELIEEMAAEIDLALAGVAMCGSCTAGVMLDAARLHKKGVPTQALSWEIFEKSARSMAKLQGVPELPLLIVSKVTGDEAHDEQRAKGRECGREIVRQLSVTPQR